MYLLLLTAVTMLAFAANSVLNRLAIVDGGMDPVVFGSARLVTGAAALALLLLWQKGTFQLGGARRIWGAGSLLLYIYGFSFAYVALDAGVGALILFGVVQLTMFAAALWGRETVPALRWIGAGLAFVGLCWLLWPDQSRSLPLLEVGLMAAAGLGWGVYSLVGRAEVNPLQATSMNFIVAAPLAALAVLVQQSAFTNIYGLALAALSGVVTSGMGYALWYAILPALGASRAAVAQLTVPVIAMGGGMVFLAEPLTTKFMIASVLVLGGVALSMKRTTSS